MRACMCEGQTSDQPGVAGRDVLFLSLSDQPGVAGRGVI